MSAKSSAYKSAARKRKEAAPRPIKKLSAVPGLSGDSGGDEADRLIYERVRLGIMSALAVNELLTFADLKQLFDVTDGNLSAHARKLEDAGYVTCTKSFEDRRPRSEYRLTAAGRKALERYLEHMEAVIKATRGR
jgi:DNA-binding MarR family transcriptional regulator